MDRIDVYLQVHKVDYEKLAAMTSNSDSSAVIRDRIRAARTRQAHRFAVCGISKLYNSEMSAQDIERCVQIEDSARGFLTTSAKQLELSGRAFHRIIKVSQTIADLDASETIEKRHILEALQYRQKKTD
jgi:magnesium chelatase family protein